MAISMRHDVPASTGEVTTRITIVPVKLGARGQLYDIWLGDRDGELLGSSRTPFYDGARALLYRGITGRFEMWDTVLPYPRMVGHIDTCAGLTVSEEDRDGLRVKPWRPAETRQDDLQGAMSDPAENT
jgi:hypothetical protein